MFVEICEFLGACFCIYSNTSDGLYKAVVLDFSLRSSCYATMLLRELQRQTTEKRYHVEALVRHREQNVVIPATASCLEACPTLDTITPSADNNTRV